MDLGGLIQESENKSSCMDQKSSSFSYPTGTENSRWETSEVCRSVDEESTRKAKDRVNTSLECWGCTNSPRYNAESFQTYRNWPNKRDPDVSEWSKQPIQEYDQHTSMMGEIMGWPGYPRAMGSDIFNGSEIYIFREEGSSHQILEIEGIWISIPHNTYVWNDEPIYIQVSAVNICSISEGKIWEI